MATATISVDEFQALEGKVLRAVELIREEREARAAAQAELVAAQATQAAQAEQIAELRQQLAAAQDGTRAEVETLEREREVVRERVGRLLAQMDELL